MQNKRGQDEQKLPKTRKFKRFWPPKSIWTRFFFKKWTPKKKPETKNENPKTPVFFSFFLKAKNENQKLQAPWGSGDLRFALEKEAANAAVQKNRVSVSIVCACGGQFRECFILWVFHFHFLFVVEFMSSCFWWGNDEARRVTWNFMLVMALDLEFASLNPPTFKFFAV